ncbi:MAG: hypothetical protein WB471_08600, partial [Nocardioides sp.]
MKLLGRVALLLACAVSLPASSSGAAGTWSAPQAVSASPSSRLVAAAETADGTLVAIVDYLAGGLRRSSRAPGADWVPGGTFSDPDGYVPTYSSAAVVATDGAAWLAYRVRIDDEDYVRVARWAPDGTSKTYWDIYEPWSIVDLAVDEDNDVLVTYAGRGGEPLLALYGDGTDGLERLDVPSWSADHRPHRWVLGPQEDVMLVSRFGSRLRTVDVGPDGDRRTRELPGSGALTDELTATIAPSGTAYLAWTTASRRATRVVHVAKRTPGESWSPDRVVDVRGRGSEPQRSLEIRSTDDGAYLAWVQSGKGSTIRGALVRSGQPVAAQHVAGARAVGDLGTTRFAIEVSSRGQLLVAWSRAREGGGQVVVAAGRVRGEPTVARLFDVDSVREPIALLRRTGEASVVSRA